MSRGQLTWHHLLLVLGVFTVVTTTVGVVRHFTPVPLGDQWDGTIGFYLRTQQDPLGAWFEQHNEHRLIFSRILFYLDVRYFGGRNVSLLAANIALTGLIALTIVHVALSRMALSGARRLGLTGATLIFTFSWMQFENFTWGFQNQWFAVCLFALWTFEAVERCADRLRSGDRTQGNGWLLAAWLCAIAAAISMASGLLAIAVAAMQAAHRRIGAARVGLTLLVGAATWLLYLRHWHPADASFDALAVAQGHPVRLVEYVLLYLGSGGSHTPLAYAGAYVWGIIVALAVLVQALGLFVSAEQALGSHIAFALFGTANALMTASGRLVYGMESALASRYTTISLLCALTLMLFSLANSKSVRGRRMTVLAGCIAIATLVVFQWLSLRGGENERYERNVSGLALRAHVYDSAVTKPVYPFEDRLIRTAKEAEAAGLSIFSPHQKDFYVAPAHVPASARCDGYVDHVWLTGTSGIYGASGWIYNAESRQVPRDVIVVNPDGDSIGTGVSGGPRDDVRAMHGDDARFSAWTAFFAASPESVFRVTGRLSNGTFCSMLGTTVGHTP